MTEPAYLTLAAGTEAVGTIEVKRSRFRGVVARAETEEQARDLVTRMRQDHRDARHHCSAFVLGPRGQTARTNDDGEPTGTAGAPMLDVLVGDGLSDVVAVVARWFGGTLLGTGGLARAYGDAVSEALRSAHLVRREQRMLSRVTLSHADAGRVEAELRSRGVEVLETGYADRATMLLATRGLHEARAAVAAATSGRAQAEPAGERWIDVPV